MKEMIAEILADYGSEVEIENADGSCAVRAFLQPVTAKSWDNMRRTIQMLGELPQGRYLYIGPADSPLADTDRILCRGVRYRVCRTEEMLLAGEAVYIWGLLQRDGGDDPWSC